MTAVQQNLTDKSAEYASSFDKGDLALPPAKKYLVRKFSSIQPLLVNTKLTSRQ
jgi:hypothetical protein